MNDGMNANRTENGFDDSSFIIHHSSFFDTHAHLDQEEFDADRGAVIARAREAGVETMICVGSVRRIEPGRAAAERRIRTCRRRRHSSQFDGRGRCPTIGSEIVALAGRPRVVALGETGLDRYRDFAPLTLQQEYLDRHLRLSRDNATCR